MARADGGMTAPRGNLSGLGSPVWGVRGAPRNQADPSEEAGLCWAVPSCGAAEKPLPTNWRADLQLAQLRERYRYVRKGRAGATVAIAVAVITAVAFVNESPVVAPAPAPATAIVAALVTSLGFDDAGSIDDGVGVGDSAGSGGSDRDGALQGHA